jgi:ABC-type uncharacterized transport system substrate-binding protein
MADDTACFARTGNLTSARARMSRRRLLTAGTILAIAALYTKAHAAPRKVGWLKIQDRSHTPNQLRSFLDGLRAAGHEEGRTFLMEYRFADGDASRLAVLARALVEAGAEMIVATSQPATDAARRTTQSVPIVARMTDDPVSSGARRSRWRVPTATSPASTRCSRK